MINLRVPLGFLAITFCSSALAQPDIHEEVQAALDWQLPVHRCKKPELRGAVSDIVDGAGVRRRYDVDTYQLERYERQQKRWRSCIKEYKQALLSDFEDLNNSAQYGLSRQQANIILGKMALIQSVLESPDAVVEEAPPS